MFLVVKIVAGFDNHHRGDQCQYGVGGGLLFTWQMRLASLYPRSMCDPSSVYTCCTTTPFIFMALLPKLAFLIFTARLLKSLS